MSYDLMVFDRSKAPNFYEDCLDWISQQRSTNWPGNGNTLEGVSQPLVDWFFKMKEVFLPLNGPYRPTDQQIDTDPDVERRLTDYSITPNLITASFGRGTVDDADRLVPVFAKECGLGFYNPQTGKIANDDMVCCLMTTERDYTDAKVIWQQIEQQLQTLDDPQRGTSNRDGAFVTLWFTNNGTDQEFMQCMPFYAKPQGSFLDKLLGKAAQSSAIESYTAEAADGKQMYTKTVATKDGLIGIMETYYRQRHIPDLSDWTDSGIL